MQAPLFHKRRPREHPGDSQPSNAQFTFMAERPRIHAPALCQYSPDGSVLETRIRRPVRSQLQTIRSLVFAQ